MAHPVCSSLLPPTGTISREEDKKRCKDVVLEKRSTHTPGNTNPAAWVDAEFSHVPPIRPDVIQRLLQLRFG